MKGLIYKDLLCLKQVGITMLLLSGFYVVMGMMNNSSGGMVNYFPMLAMSVSLMLPLNCAGYDEQCDWDVFGNALPVSRRQVVLARYGANLIVMLAAAAIAVGTDFLYYFVFHSPLNVAEMCYPLVVSLLYVAIFQPIIYKFGANKSRFIIVAIMVLPLVLFAVLIFGLLALPDADPVSLSDAAAEMEEVNIDIDVGAAIERMAVPASLIGTAVCGGLYALSCLLSMSIYQKKQF